MVVVEGDEDEKIEEMDRWTELTGIRTRCSSWAAERRTGTAGKVRGWGSRLGA